MSEFFACFNKNMLSRFSRNECGINPSRLENVKAKLEGQAGQKCLLLFSETQYSAIPRDLNLSFRAKKFAVREESSPCMRHLIVVARLCVSQTHRLFNEARCSRDNRYHIRFVDFSGLLGLTQVRRHETSVSDDSPGGTADSQPNGVHGLPRTKEKGQLHCERNSIPYRRLCAQKRGPLPFERTWGSFAGFGPEKPVFLSVLERLPALEHIRNAFTKITRAQPEPEQKPLTPHVLGSRYPRSNKNFRRLWFNVILNISITEIR